MFRFIWTYGTNYYKYIIHEKFGVFEWRDIFLIKNDISHVFLISKEDPRISETYGIKLNANSPAG